MYINLLPNNFVARQAVRRQCRAWSIVVIVAITCGGVYYAKDFSRVIKLRQQVDSELFKHPGLRQIAAEVGQWERELLRAETMANAIDRLRTDKRTLTLVGLVARSAINGSGKTRLQHLSIRLPSAHPIQPIANGGQVQRGSPGLQTDSTRGSLTLEGVADDANTISRFVTMLRETGILTQVNLKGSSVNAVGSDRCRQFQIECEI